MAFIEGLFTLVGRILLVAIFLGAAVQFIQHPAETQDSMRKKQIERLYPENEQTIPALMWAAVGCLTVGGISVLFGYKARFGAFLLIIFLAAATYFFHPVWNYRGTDQFETEMAHFLKNVAIGGGLFVILARGAGRFSIDGPGRVYDDF